MSRADLLHRAEAFVVACALWLLRRLGPVAASNLGGVVARTVGPLLPVSKVARGNLALALTALSAQEQRRVLRDVWDNLGRTVGEFPHLARLRVDVEGAVHLRGDSAGGAGLRPTLFITGHLANWEVLPMVADRAGVPLSIVYRAAKNPYVDQMIRDLRRAPLGGDVVNFPKGARGARGALGHLAKGGALGMLVDQKMNDGIEAPFFGRPAMTAPAAAAFALRFRARVVMARVQRMGPAHLRVVVEPALTLPDGADRMADILTLTTMFNTTLERWIRERPGDWLWLHRRWPKVKA